jgi:hypothetical protein
MHRCENNIKTDTIIMSMGSRVTRRRTRSDVIILMKVPVPKVDQDVEHFNNCGEELDGPGVCMG